MGNIKIKTWEARQSRGLSLAELSEKSGISKSTLNNIENGIISPKMDQMYAIAEALDMKITDLFDSDRK